MFRIGKLFPFWVVCLCVFFFRYAGDVGEVFHVNKHEKEKEIRMERSKQRRTRRKRESVNLRWFLIYGDDETRLNDCCLLSTFIVYWSNGCLHFEELKKLQTC